MVCDIFPSDVDRHCYTQKVSVAHVASVLVIIILPNLVYWMFAILSKWVILFFISVCVAFGSRFRWDLEF